MVVTLKYNWNSQRLIEHMHNKARIALEEIGVEAESWFDAIVPIDTGALSRTWKSDVTDTGGFWITLTYSMGGGDVDYAVYVELGTMYMLPRATLRTVAQEVWPFIPEHLKEALSSA